MLSVDAPFFNRKDRTASDPPAAAKKAAEKGVIFPFMALGVSMDAPAPTNYATEREGGREGSER